MTDMIVPQPKDAIHKAWLYRTLMAIFDNVELATVLSFKGGTCAAMLGYLDRFSVDLDFDYIGDPELLPATKIKLEKIFDELGLVIDDQSKVVPQYFLKYEAILGGRNTLKIDVSVVPPKSNIYEQKRFNEIDRIIQCQTIETMMANKLVAIIDRYERNKSIAARDIYDTHHFFLRGYRYSEAVIYERTGKGIKSFLLDLIVFIEQRITDEIITQDLNMLLPHDKFARLRKILKAETLMFLRDEVARCG